MSSQFPSSRGGFRVRFSPFDVVWAGLSPLVALFLRDAPVLSDDGAGIALLYCTISFTFSLISFLAFRVSAGVAWHLSVEDVFNTIKAVVMAGLLTSIVLFALTRLEGIPRSVPFLNMLILAAGLFTARMAALLFHERPRTAEMPNEAVEHAIIIGSTQLSSLYIKLLRAYRPCEQRIVAVLEPQPNLIGRTICGVPIIAPPEQLKSIVEEYRVHGVGISRVIVGGDETLLAPEQLANVRRVCDEGRISIDFIPDLVGLSQRWRYNKIPNVPVHRPTAVFELPGYFQFKRGIDFFGALTAIMVLSPALLITAFLVLIDVGSPVLFWQQRIGQGGRTFLIRKFRTLRSPFDCNGRPANEEERLTGIGNLLRKLRLDELPQLFNVLVGDMSLIGPRPLLPRDQPAKASIRLSVRPGITGWAQVNGGSLIDPEEKGALDEWYVRHASISLDVRIVALTLRFLLTGEQRSEEAVSAARAQQFEEVPNHLGAHSPEPVALAAELRRQHPMAPKQKLKLNPRAAPRAMSRSAEDKSSIPGWQIKPLQ